MTERRPDRQVAGSEENSTCHADQLGMRSPVDVTSKLSSLVVSSGETKPKSIVEDLPIFDPIRRDSLVHIVNQLDLSSFLKLARTCRAMNEVCFSTKGIDVLFGGIAKTNFSSLRLAIEVEKDVTQPDQVRFTLNKICGNTHETQFSDEQITKLRKMPFRVVTKMYINVQEQISRRHLLALREYLRRFHRAEIFSIYMVFGTSDWNLLAEIHQEFRVLELIVKRRIVTPIPEDLLFHFATNLQTFIYHGTISDDVILASTATFIAFPMARISVETFKKLLQRFAVGPTLLSGVGRQLTAIHDPVRSDPFLNACSKVMKVAQVANVDFIIKDPGVLYWSPDSPREFHLLRADGSTGFLEINLDLVVFAPKA